MFLSDLKPHQTGLIILTYSIVTSSFTIEEDKKDAWVGELFATEQVDVFHSEIKSQFDDGPILHVSGDVRHQSQVLHQTAGLQTQIPLVSATKHTYLFYITNNNRKITPFTVSN